MDFSTLPKSSRGFTLVELLVVISVIAVLFGVVISVINPAKHLNRTEDGVRLTNMQKTVETLAAYIAAEGQLPADLNNNYNPLDDANGLNQFMAQWPTGGTMEYVTYESDEVFCLSVNMAEYQNTHFKYLSGQTAGNPAQCNGILVKQCPTSCSDDAETSGCLKINEVSCS